MVVGGRDSGVLGREQRTSQNRRESGPRRAQLLPGKPNWRPTEAHALCPQPLPSNNNTQSACLMFSSLSAVFQSTGQFEAKKGFFSGWRTFPKKTHVPLTLTLVVEAVVLVVVPVVVVLQGGGAAGTQLGQSAAGGRELGAEVGHLLTGRLDGPIDPVCQVFVVFHHFKDFPLRTKPTQSSMMSSGGEARTVPSSSVVVVVFFLSSPHPPPVPLLPQFTSRTCTFQ